MLFLNIFVLFSAICIGSIQAINSQYTVVAPGTIHSPGKYDVVVAVYNTSEPCQIQIGVRGPTYHDSIVVDLSANELKNIHFDVPQVEAGDYYLTAEGLKGITFKNETKLDYVAFVPHVMIQNDRGEYFPYDIIKFRVIFTDENLKPAKPTANTVLVVEDPQGKRFKEYNSEDIKVKHGVFSEQLQLPEIYGDWHIKVYAGQKVSAEAEFSVFSADEDDERFTIDLQMTYGLTVKDNSVPVVVKAFYKNNNPVNGIVKLSFIVDGTEDIKTLPEPYVGRLVDGRAIFQVNLQKLHINEERGWSSFDTVATVKEDFTDAEAKKSSFGKLYVQRYNVEHKGWTEWDFYTPNVEKELTLYIKHVNGTIIKDITTPIKLICTETRESYAWGEPSEYENLKEPPQKIEYESHANSDGEIKFNVKLGELTNNMVHYYKMSIEYEGENIPAGKLRPEANNASNDAEQNADMKKLDFNIERLHKKQKNNLIVGQEEVFRLSYSKGFNYFVYTIVGRGNIIHSERITLPDKVESYDFKLVPTIPMCPYAHLSFNFIDDAGVLHFAEKIVFVRIELENKLQVSAAEVVKPGTNVSLHIKTPKNSFVALMGLNQKALHSFTFNDINYYVIRAHLSSYLTRTLWQHGSGEYPGASSGLVTLTNANYNYEKTLDDATTKKYETMEHDYAPYVQVPKSFEPKQEWSFYGVENPELYWFYEDVENTENYEFVLTKEMPKDALTTWYISAFSINAEHGLAIIEKPFKIKTYQPYYVLINLPPTIKIGELLEVQTVVHNFAENADNDVEITFVANEKEFDFVTINNELITEQKLVQRLHIEADSAKSAKFIIRPKKAGDIQLQFHIKSSIETEHIYKTLKVLPDTQLSTLASFAEVKIKSDTPRYKLDMNVCLHEPTDKEYEPTLEVSLPSGYVADLEALKPLKRNSYVKSFETRNAKTVIIIKLKKLYILKDNHDTLCLPIVAYKSFNVVLQQPSEIVLRSTYSADKTSTMHYDVNSNICDICEMNENCKKECKQ